MSQSTTGSESFRRPTEATGSINPDFDVLWAAWQARGAAHDRAIRRRLIVVACALAIPTAILCGLWLR
jgi:hypothetical protein